MPLSAGMSAADYVYSGTYDPVVFRAEYEKDFKHVPKFNDASIPDLLFVLDKIGKDSRITDIRWAAYMLATIYIESSHVVKVTKQTKDRHGRIKTVTLKQWRNFTPNAEMGRGKGLNYGLPVKVFKLPNGNARVTEIDGDQFNVRPDGSYSALVKGGKPSLKAPDVPVEDAYKKDGGDEQIYFGRGYVQLTWWFNYASAGAELGRGLDFIFDPELVNDPSIAYSILATGMCTGKIYANRRTFTKYFTDSATDYVGARDMVNAGTLKANKVEVGDIAERLEKILLASRRGVRAVAT